MVDFPTPPFAEDTAMIFRTSSRLRFSGNPRWRRGSCGGAATPPERGNPFENSIKDTIFGKVFETYQWVLMLQLS